ncbi:type II toxin-antitoxin system VapC family toxin [Methyloprofundus sp.]|uniref:type II toxin-antitoxin system VapC family toxin n=1 Tax=Methyloprofundus sp. TaxID=2020875 RepID=UPI003D13032C
MYLIDTNVISEVRKQNKANRGVINFFKIAQEQETRLFVSVITVGELRRGVNIIRHRGDKPQADSLEQWLKLLLNEYADNILDFTATEAQVWGQLRVPHYENALDKQIAATALTYDLTVVTRNEHDFIGCGVSILNPFE